MFERKKHAPPQKRIDSLIGTGTVVEGDVTFSGGLRIDGTVRGNVTTANGEPGTLVVSEQARIDGEIKVSHVVVNGTVNGPVTANDFLELQAKARTSSTGRSRCTLAPSSRAGCTTPNRERPAWSNSSGRRPNSGFAPGQGGRGRRFTSPGPVGDDVARDRGLPPRAKSQCEESTMNAMNEMPAPLIFTDSAAAKVRLLIEEEGNPELKLRVFVSGGGCSGFQYGFTFDEVANDDDTAMVKDGVTLLIDPMSYQYLVGAEIDYTEGLEGAQFVIKNPNATTTCGCGFSA